jgi:hypothetical protein
VPRSRLAAAKKRQRGAQRGLRIALWRGLGIFDLKTASKFEECHYLGRLPHNHDLSSAVPMAMGFGSKSTEEGIKNISIGDLICVVYQSESK